jgi:hypothetical protein
MVETDWSAFLLIPIQTAVDALLIMAHPRRRHVSDASYK